ncbi:MAG TPA: membrane protein insertion efficiency factor YidD [Azospirillaceae bacterium]|nr:membrane protein insertion efficiency factor YidD [Azospirillaceae bacterium]
MSPLAHVLRALVVAYRWTLSPVLGRNCRFHPTCSQYALDALSKHGALKGGVLAAWRIVRCNPWGGMGYDPVPEPSRRHGCRTAGCDHAAGDGGRPGLL